MVATIGGQYNFRVTCTPLFQLHESVALAFAVGNKHSVLGAHIRDIPRKSRFGARANTTKPGNAFSRRALGRARRRRGRRGRCRHPSQADQRRPLGRGRVSLPAGELHSLVGERNRLGTCLVRYLCVAELFHVDPIANTAVSCESHHWNFSRHPSCLPRYQPPPLLHCDRADGHQIQA